MALDGIPPIPIGMPIVDPKTGAASREFAQWWQMAIAQSITLETVEEYTRYFRALSEEAGASATGADSVAVGPQSVASGGNAIAVGRESVASASNTSAFGFRASASGGSSTAVGGGSVATGTNSTAVGRFAEANSSQATGIGYLADATGTRSGAFGANAVTNATDASAFGSAANASFIGSTAVGYQATTTATNQVTLGGSTNSVRIGSITSSTAAQSGATQTMTVDANGVIGQTSVSGTSPLLYSNFTAVNNGATTGSLVSLMSYTLPANTVSAAGDFLEIEFWADCAASASGTKAFNYLVGSSTVGGFSQTISAARIFRMRFILAYASASSGIFLDTIRTWADTPYGTPLASTGNFMNLNTNSSIDWTSDQTFAVRLQSNTASNITARGHTIKLYKAV